MNDDDADYEGIYAQELGRDLALVVQTRTATQGTAAAFEVAAVDGDGNHLFQIASVRQDHPELLTVMMPTYAQQAIERQKAYAADSACDWTSWPTIKEDWENTPGPIEEGRILKWLDPIATSEKPSMTDESSRLRLYWLIGSADKAFDSGDMERYEDLNEEIRKLVDAHPELRAAAETNGILGGGPA